MPQEELTPDLQKEVPPSESPPSASVDEDGEQLQRATTKQWGVLKFRPYDDGDEQDWWFASIACPLLAATLGPLANVLSIGAYVSTWRGTQQFSADYPQLSLVSIPDPKWALKINVASLVLGYVGNVFLLANFTNRIRYIVALPFTIVCWFLSTWMLVGILIAMHIYQPPIGPDQIYTQGFWCGVIAAALYGFCDFVLLINMLGYFLGHYPQKFNLTSAQRTLILQTMLFFIWLAGGGGIFSALQSSYSADPADHWLFTDALYFCDVTILTIGFGDEYPTNDIARGFVLPYAIIGIIMLGLMIGSISSFAAEISKENVMKKHVENRRVRTIERSKDKDDMAGDAQRRSTSRRRSSVLSRRAQRLRDRYDAPQEEEVEAIQRQSPNVSYELPEKPQPDRVSSNKSTKSLLLKPFIGSFTQPQSLMHPRRTIRRSRKSRALILREEKDRFNAMRHIQSQTKSWKNWTSLFVSVIAFSVLWFVGAAVFYVTERNTQDMSYFRALYFCYVSLLTIGYGDLSPKSTAGRPFFIVWSLLAVPTMTILVSDLSSTVIKGYTESVNNLADFTVLPKYGVWRDFVRRHPTTLGWADLEKLREERQRRQRLERGFETGPDPDAEDALDGEEEEEVAEPRTLQELAGEDVEGLSEWELGRRLAAAIRRAAGESRREPGKRYSYEEWVEYTELIRFTSARSRRRRKRREKRRRLAARLEEEEKKDEAAAALMESEEEGEELEEDEDEGLIEWDWIGANSPMMADQSEPEFVLERLCESMARFVKQQGRELGGLAKSKDGGS